MFEDIGAMAPRTEKGNTFEFLESYIQLFKKKKEQSKIFIFNM